MMGAVVSAVEVVEVDAGVLEAAGAGLAVCDCVVSLEPLHAASKSAMAAIRIVCFMFCF